MEKLYIKLDKKRWKIFHDFEERKNRAFLKKLSTRQSFKAAASLYGMINQACNETGLSVFRAEKLKSILNTHKILNRVRP